MRVCGNLGHGREGGAVTARESFGLTDDKLGEDRGERRKRIKGGGQ